MGSSPFPPIPFPNRKTVTLDSADVRDLECDCPAGALTARGLDYEQCSCDTVALFVLQDGY